MDNATENTSVPTMKTLYVTQNELQILKAAITALDLMVGKTPTEEHLAHLSKVICDLRDDNENTVATAAI